MSTVANPLSLLCAVNVTAGFIAPAAPEFNVGAISGSAGVIPAFGTNPRIRKYTSQAAMLLDGFQPTDLEYIAAGLYFSQVPTPGQVDVIGEDPTAIQTFSIGSAAGADYAVGDLVGITQGAAVGGFLKVATVSGGGVVETLSLVAGKQGSGFLVANNLPTTTTGAGSGLLVDILTVGETPLQAITAARIADPSFYTVMSTTAVDADSIALGTWAQSAQPATQYLYGTGSAAALAGTAGNVFSTLKAASISRAHGSYATTQGGNAPNNPLVAAAVSGVAMGRNTGLANSAFTLSGKTLVGILPENLNLEEFSVFAGQPGVDVGNCGNVLLNFANTYSLYIQGINANGTFFDQVLGLDMLAADAQLSTVGAYASLGSIPQDNAGQATVLQAVSAACGRSATRGFLAGGTWTGPTILGITPGTSLPDGFAVVSDSFANQSPADHALRKGMPVYICVILAGSQQSFIIGINAQS
jgi:hypothetical protein